MNEESNLEKLLTWFLHRRCYASCTEDLEEKMLEIALSLNSLSKPTGDGEPERGSLAGRGGVMYE